MSVSAAPLTPPARPPDCVLDVRVPLAWIVVSQATAYADDVLRRMPLLVVAVPACWPHELVDAVFALERRGSLTAAQVGSKFAILGGFGIDVDRSSLPRVWTETLDLARRCRIGVYDAAYLELALRLAVPLATATAKLRRAATAAGVPIFAP